MLKRSSIFLSGVAILMVASLVHADAATDLMAELGMTVPPSSTDTSTQFSFGASTTSIDTSLTTTVSTTSAPNPEAEKAKQIQTLRDLIKKLTAQLQALIAAKKKAVASLSDTSDVCNIKRSLGRGMKGSDVSALQKFLVGEAELQPEGVSGSFGEVTEYAVQQWQMHNGIVSYGSPETTGYGYVGKATLAQIQQSCTKSAQGTTIDPGAAKTGNFTQSYSGLKKVRISLSIDGDSYQRGMLIPVRVTVQDPVPYLGAAIDFIQPAKKSTDFADFFGSRVYLPVGFVGQITHNINASHMEIADADKAFGVTHIPLQAVVEARFRRPNDTQDAYRIFGSSDPVDLYISEDPTKGNLVFTVNGIDGDKSGDIKSDFAKYFSATTTSRSNGIEFCDLLSTVVTKGVPYSCKWNDQELADIIAAKRKRIKILPQPRDLGSYFLFINGSIVDTQLDIPKSDALSSCGKTHIDKPTDSMTCIWENEIIYDKGGLEDPPSETYIEPGAAPITL